MTNLTEKQKRFADEYLVSLNATQSAIKAGYSEKYANTNASKLLQNTTIKSYIENRMAEKDKELIASQDEVLKYLTRVLRGESLSEEIVIEARDGITEARRMEKAPSEKEKLKAAELLGKRYGLYTDNKADVDNNINITVVRASERDGS